MQKNREEAEEEEWTERLSQSSLGTRSTGESFPVICICFLDSASQGNRAMGYQLIPFLWEKDWSKGELRC